MASMMQLSLWKTLSFSSSLSSPANRLSLPAKLSHLSLTTASPPRRKLSVIRMGGGPRTFPGGVSKWQWKRMQAKKQKQLLKARLCRERQIYEMRKRAELKAAVAELERPWEPVEKPPNLFSVSADEQVKVLADRFQRPGGFDLWTDRDGPQLFETVDDLPSARFFPKGVVHSVKPYRSVSSSVDSDAEGEKFPKDDGIEGVVAPKSGENRRNIKHRGRGLRKRIGFDIRPRKEGDTIQNRVNGDKRKNGRSQVYDMALRKDGSYEFGS
ncbi:PREDICTED: putative DEAD-box ATP-dependent RNA helicase 33 [Tarenaya hassleriana]|uniref:putative DEAD-box ATP-dependent RNA helicase 33 n=1 Tax=Tarenaya hassleriana TaxID=28532 RepID=UPI00053C2CFB|nr:PREDICTED: putative DEAD-box ATP-dependent RNA helicase 33 [Tarenaya hassleriana]